MLKKLSAAVLALFLFSSCFVPLIAGAELITATGSALAWYAEQVVSDALVDMGVNAVQNTGFWETLKSDLYRDCPEFAAFINGVDLDDVRSKDNIQCVTVPADVVCSARDFIKSEYGVTSNDSLRYSEKLGYVDGMKSVGGCSLPFYPASIVEKAQNSDTLICADSLSFDGYIFYSSVHTVGFVDGTDNANLVSCVNIQNSSGELEYRYKLGTPVAPGSEFSSKNSFYFVYGPRQEGGPNYMTIACRETLMKSGKVFSLCHLTSSYNPYNGKTSNYTYLPSQSSYFEPISMELFPGDDWLYDGIPIDVDYDRFSNYNPTGNLSYRVYPDGNDDIMTYTPDDVNVTDFFNATPTPAPTPVPTSTPAPTSGAAPSPAASPVGTDSPDTNFFVTVNNWFNDFGNWFEFNFTPKEGDDSIINKMSFDTLWRKKFSFFYDIAFYSQEALNYVHSSVFEYPVFEMDLSALGIPGLGREVVLDFSSTQAQNAFRWIRQFLDYIIWVVFGCSFFKRFRVYFTVSGG